MEKRITSITLNNCRAYYDVYDPIVLPKGENLLIYGENGSGKSSLYKGLNNYFASSIEPTMSFVTNKYRPNDEGRIDICFSDFDTVTDTIVDGTDASYHFGSLGSNQTEPFIKTTALIKGFLDYTDLLKVYLHSEPEPNLFDLIVLSLLGQHTPITAGGNTAFKPKWEKLQYNLKKCYTRNDLTHRYAYDELPIFETQLRVTLNQVFTELNRLLDEYFNSLRIQLSYRLLPLTFNYVWPKEDWYTTADLRLEVSKDGTLITGGYSDYLNEARLSAIAICLYLASLRCNPSAIDLKILFLDDVFIGLDLGNRLPILKILQEEFKDYQKFISTYDRHWFEMAKKYFDLQKGSFWQSLEIYAGIQTLTGFDIAKPIIVNGTGHFEKGTQYLHNNNNPDYPAAANYFRKGLEKLIQDYIPKYELADSQHIQIAEYRLGALLKKANLFLNKTGNDTTDLATILVFINVLLHPLSHHEITTPIYKEELLILEKALYSFKKHLIGLEIATKYKCVLEKASSLRLTLMVDTTTNTNHYFELVLKDNLVMELPIIPSINLFDSACYLRTMYGTINGKSTNFSPSKKDSRFNYTSLHDVVTRIVSFISPQYPNLSAPVNYQDAFEYHDGKDWLPLQDKLN